MNTAPEKPVTVFKNSLLMALDIMALISCLIVVTNSLLSMTGLFTLVTTYLSISSVLFDIIFVYAFFFHVFKKGWPVPWLTGLSSIAALLLVSGRYTAFWFGYDSTFFIYSGNYWFVLAAAFRLQRLTGSFSSKSVYSLWNKNTDFLKNLLAVCLILIVLAAFAFDFFVLPGMQQEKQYSLTHLAEAFTAIGGLLLAMLYACSNSFHEARMKSKISVYRNMQPKAGPAGSDELEGILGKKKRW